MSEFVWFFVVIPFVLCQEINPTPNIYNVKFTNLGACGDNGTCPPGRPPPGEGEGPGQPVDPPPTPGQSTDYSIIREIWSTGQVVCGTADGSTSARGIARFDADICRAVAAAFWDDARTSEARVRYVTTNDQSRLLVTEQSGVQIVSHCLVKTTLRALTHPIMFGPVMLWDRVGVLVPQNNNANDVPNFEFLQRSANARYCVVRNSETESILPVALNIPVAQRNGPDSRILRYDTEEQAFTAWQQLSCFGFASKSLSILQYARLYERRSDNPNPVRQGRVLLPRDCPINADNPNCRDVTLNPSKMLPLAPAVTNRDRKFAMLVEVVLNGLLIAAEQGITKNDAADSLTNLGQIYPPQVAAELEIGPNFMRSVIATVGNYDEMYASAFGDRTQRFGNRGPNARRRAGGVFIAHS